MVHGWFFRKFAWCFYCKNSTGFPLSPPSLVLGFPFPKVVLLCSSDPGCNKH